MGKAITDTAGIALGKNTQFTLESSPPKGAVMILQRTTPARIDTVMNLN